MRRYCYVGPPDIQERVRGARAPKGAPLRSPEALDVWVRSTRQEPSSAGLIAATYVVDLDGVLRVADRHSEHVACAGGAPVLAAGEVFFRREGGSWAVEEVSNQSTGYCPEPDCWGAVEAALDGAGIEHPGGFTLELVFRKCPACGQRNIVKDGDFFCAVDDHPLPKRWNFGTPLPRGG